MISASFTRVVAPRWLLRIAACGLCALPLAVEAGQYTLTAGRAGSPKQSQGTLAQGTSANSLNDKASINGVAWDSGANYIAYLVGRRRRQSPQRGQHLGHRAGDRRQQRPLLFANAAGRRTLRRRSTDRLRLARGRGHRWQRRAPDDARPPRPRNQVGLDQPSGKDEIAVRDRPGSEDIELHAEVELPAYLDSTASVNVELATTSEGDGGRCTVRRNRANGQRVRQREDHRLQRAERSGCSGDGLPDE